MGAAVLFGQGRFWEAAKIQAVLGERLPDMSPAEVAWLACALRRLDVGQVRRLRSGPAERYGPGQGRDDDDWLLRAAQQRLAERQGSDGSWPSDDGEAFTVHTVLTAIRACR